jgi:hypothetical protein
MILDGPTLIFKLAISPSPAYLPLDTLDSTFTVLFIYSLQRNFDSYLNFIK